MNQGAKVGFYPRFETFCTPALPKSAFKYEQCPKYDWDKSDFEQSSAGHFTVAQVNVLKG